MLRPAVVVPLVVLLTLVIPAFAGLTVYDVGKRVADLPSTVPDFSTPESAYATIHRMVASGDEDWASVSPRRLADRMPKPSKRDVPPEVRQGWLSARILEVRILDNHHASVLADSGARHIDIRSFELENGRWLNTGQDLAPDLDAARRRSAELLSHHVAKPTRPPVVDPDAHLMPFVDYLRNNASDPREFVLSAFDRHAVVAIGEVHHRPDYWRLNSALIEDPRFPKLCGTIYLELPQHGQPLVEQFLAADELDTTPVIDVLRDMMELGWPDQETVDFFSAVWTVNRSLPPDRRLRIVLVDMPRPWKLVATGVQLRTWAVDRDRLMANAILKDRVARHDADTRGALFVAGFMHVAANVKYAADPSLARATAGHHLRQSLGDRFYAALQHTPSIHNVGGATEGRPALGLFDSAFAALDQRPVAFPLGHPSPFGRLPFDADADIAPATCATYADCFDAYLYLLPLENESFATIIPDFYSDDFLREVDRRQRLFARNPGPTPDPVAVRRRLESEWGKPHRFDRLGPADAWQSGDDWKSTLTDRAHRQALNDPAPLRAQALRLLESIRDADYAHPELNVPIDYRTDHWIDEWAKWIIAHFSQNPITRIEVADHVRPSTWRYTKGCPAVRYALTLKDGSQIDGLLPFQFDPLSSTWQPVAGLDWHLPDRPK